MACSSCARWTPRSIACSPRRFELRLRLSHVAPRRDARVVAVRGQFEGFLERFDIGLGAARPPRRGRGLEVVGGDLRVDAEPDALEIRRARLHAARRGRDGLPHASPDVGFVRGIDRQRDRRCRSAT